jgi:integrase
MKRKVIVTYRWLEPPPIDRLGQQVPRNQWPRKRRRSWVVRWHAADGKRPQRSFNLKTDADEFAASKQAEFDRNPTARRTPKRITLGQFADELAALNIGPRAQRLMPASARELRKAMGTLIGFLGKDIPLTEISSQHAARFVAHLQSRPNKRAPKRELSLATVNKTVRTVKVAFNIAIRQLGYLQTNPFLYVSQQKVPDKPKRYVKPAELVAILRACDDAKVPDQELWWKCFVTLLYTTGLRVNEAVYLTWSDIDFERNTVTVIAREGVLSFQPKGKRSRSVPLPMLTMDLLAKLQLTAEQSNPYIFIQTRQLENVQKAKPVDRAGAIRDPIPGLHAAWRTLLKRADVSYATFHDLRRSAITNWARRIPIQVTQRLAGHVSVATTMQFYVGVLDDDMDNARQAIEATIALPKNTQDALRTQ